ncbi:MAG TPA: flavin reductase family protein [Dehalococcoidia bacterium]|nr:flavin reductase family protein [Dehalococcoidia bacterium]
METTLRKPRRRGDILRDEIAAALAEMPYGLYIIGSTSDGEANGMMADWLMQVSFSPRLLAVAIENDAHTLENIRANPRFTVNFLAADEMALASKFAQPYFGSKVKGRPPRSFKKVHHKLEDVEHHLTASGVPVLAAAMAWLECEAESFVPAGDHTLVIARVHDGSVLRDVEPLTSTITGWVYAG